MQNETILIVRFIFSGLFCATLLAGIYLFRNYERFFGVDPTIPSETGSARTYSKVQIFLVLAHALVLTAAFALMVH